MVRQDRMDTLDTVHIVISRMSSVRGLSTHNYSQFPMGTMGYNGQLDIRIYTDVRTCGPGLFLG